LAAFFAAGRSEGMLPIGVRLILLAAAYVVGGVLSAAAPGAPSFAVLTLLAIGMLVWAALRRPKEAFAGGFVVLLDLAWVMFALYFTGGLASPLVPLLYAVVALAGLRANKPDGWIALGGATVGIFTIAYAWQHGDPAALRAAAGQAALLGAVTLAVRMYMGWSRAARLRAAATARMYRDLLGHVQDFVIATDTSWRVIEANASARSAFELSRAGASPTAPALAEVLHPLNPVACESMMAAVACGQRVMGVMLDVIDAQGEHRVLDCTAVPFGCSGGLSGTHVILRDVTAAESHRRNLARPGSQASIDEMVGTITHELNNPLAAIRLNAELAMFVSELPELNDIMAQVDRCKRVIQDLRMYTRDADGAQDPASHEGMPHPLVGDMDKVGV
jgi:signal transduction histidine kinase